MLSEQLQWFCGICRLDESHALLLIRNFAMGSWILMVDHHFPPFFGVQCHIIQRLWHVQFWEFITSLSSICLRSYPQYLGDVQLGHVPTPVISGKPNYWLNQHPSIPPYTSNVFHVGELPCLQLHHDQWEIPARGYFPYMLLHVISMIFNWLRL